MAGLLSYKLKDQQRRTGRRRWEMMARVNRIAEAKLCVLQIAMAMRLAYSSLGAFVR
jgi:hypothetical protein